jgi:hypothetical protein
MIEMKANTREMDHIDLLMNWKWFEWDNNRVNLDFKRSDCKVMVTGSTAWLKEQAKIAIANQDGYTNPNTPKNNVETDEGDDN